MAEPKSKIKEKYSLSVEGILNLDGEIFIEVDGIPKPLKELLSKVNGELIKLNASKTDELD